MALLFGYQANALFADTGFEHQVLYDRVDLMQAAVRNWHNNSFQIIRVKNEKLNSLPDEIRRSKFYPSFKARYCTRKFKIEPCDDHLRQYESEPDGVELMIGLNAEEAELRTGNQGDLPFVRYTYPLVDLGINRAKCEEILNAADLHPNFPPYMKRGGCKGCYYKSKKEYAAMALYVPSEFDEVVQIEEDIQDVRTKKYHVIDSIPNLKAFKAQATSTLFTKEEMYPVINAASSCGIFCNR